MPQIDALRAASKGMGRGGVAVVGKPRLTKGGRRRQTGKKVPDRLRVVGRTCVCMYMLLVPQTAACGCLKGAFVVLRFSFPFALGRFVLCHISVGRGTGHDTSFFFKYI